jgi:hypothetical protein
MRKMMALKENNIKFIQGFGKLPIYADYISHVFDDEAAIWKQYLMEAFQLPQFFLDKGLHPFIFQPDNSNQTIIGTIEPSNDGIREFPFSLFIQKPDLNHEEDLEHCIHIWHFLIIVRWQLSQIQDISECYAYLETQRIDISKKEKLPDALLKKLGNFLINARLQTLIIGNDIDFTFGE